MARRRQAQTLDRAKLDQFLDRLAEKDKAMGSLTIARDGDVPYTRAIGYGQIDGADRKSLNAASRFRIAPITKMSTAVMVPQLMDEGKLRLTEHILLNERADYGAQVHQRLARDTGGSERRLYQCARFHRCFPTLQPAAKLTRTHSTTLCRAEELRQQDA